MTSFCTLAFVQARTAAAAEPAAMENPAVQKSDCGDNYAPRHIRTLPSETNAIPQSFSLEFSHPLAWCCPTGEVESVCFTKTCEDAPKSSLGRYIRQHMDENQDFRFFSRVDHHGHTRKFLSSVIAGYGELFNDDGSTVTRGSNGTRRESPGFLFLRSTFQF